MAMCLFAGICCVLDGYIKCLIVRPYMHILFVACYEPSVCVAAYCSWTQSEKASALLHRFVEPTAALGACLGSISLLWDL